MNPAAMGGMPMGGMGGPPGGKKKKEAYVIPKLIKNDKNNMFYKAINAGFKVVYIVYDFSRKIMWFVSCLAFMYFVPMSFEIFSEQQRILSKIQAQMMSDGLGGMGGADVQPNIRPF